MKTKALVVMSVYLMCAAIPVFAQTHQEEVICRMTAGNCLHEEKTRDEAKRVEKTSPETMVTLEQMQEDFKARLQGVAVSRAETKGGESTSPETTATLEQMQEDFKARLQGNEPRPRL
jgi:hypothetical protein